MAIRRSLLGPPAKYHRAKNSYEEELSAEDLDEK
jgi:hypothetical protein